VRQRFVVLSSRLFPSVSFERRHTGNPLKGLDIAGSRQDGSCKDGELLPGYPARTGLEEGVQIRQDVLIALQTVGNRMRALDSLLVQFFDPEPMFIAMDQARARDRQCQSRQGYPEGRLSNSPARETGAALRFFRCG
jgi:hypothetical protein